MRQRDDQTSCFSSWYFRRSIIIQSSRKINWNILIQKLNFEKFHELVSVSLIKHSKYYDYIYPHEQDKRYKFKWYTDINYLVIGGFGFWSLLTLIKVEIFINYWLSPEKFRRRYININMKVIKVVNFSIHLADSSLSGFP